MRMRLDTKVFRKIGKAPIKLKPWTKKDPPPNTEDPWKSIKNLARFAGMRAIPRRTVLAFRYYPYFRYCFYALMLPVYDNNFRGVREDLIRLLKNPDSMTLEDICRGMGCYLNNFTENMPGGANRKQFENAPPHRAVNKRTIFKAIDSALDEMGMKELAEERRAEVKQNPDDYQLKREYLHLALVVFEKLVKNGFKREELWT